MSGETQRAICLAENALEDLGDSPKWVLQGYGLLSADILQLCGEGQRATKVAMETLEGIGSDPLSGAYAGTVARWVAITSIAQCTPERGLTILRGTLKEIDNLDLIDQAEVLAALRWVEVSVGSDKATEAVELIAKLGALPQAIPTQIRRLGIPIHELA
jgi:hypothetical protein